MYGAIAALERASSSKPKSRQCVPGATLPIQVFRLKIDSVAGADSREHEAVAGIGHKGADKKNMFLFMLVRDVRVTEYMSREKRRRESCGDLRHVGKRTRATQALVVSRRQSHRKTKGNDGDKTIPDMEIDKNNACQFDTAVEQFSQHGSFECSSASKGIEW